MEAAGTTTGGPLRLLRAAPRRPPRREGGLGRALPLLAACGLLPGCAGPAGGAAVMIRAERPDLADPGDRVPVSAGVGFSVGDGILVTCAHTVGGQREVEVEARGALGLAVRSGGRVERVVEDIALIRVAALRLGRPLASDPLQRGERVRILDPRRTGAAPIAAVADGPEWLLPLGPAPRLGPGLSGAPVLDEEGRVAGMVYGLLEAEGDLRIGIYTAAEIARALRSDVALHPLPPSGR